MRCLWYAKDKARASWYAGCRPGALNYHNTATEYKVCPYCARARETMPDTFTYQQFLVEASRRACENLMDCVRAADPITGRALVPIERTASRELTEEDVPAFDQADFNQLSPFAKTLYLKARAMANESRGVMMENAPYYPAARQRFLDILKAVK